jgi:cytochrome c oxidase cbb3-type subunit 4
MIDVNILRALITLVSFISFIGIVWWAWSSRRASAFTEAANLPFADEEMQQRTIMQQRSEVPVAEQTGGNNNG